jgi:hypothetical protein
MRRKGASLSVLVTYCESDAPQVCQEIPGDDQGASDEVLRDGVIGDAHVEKEEDYNYCTEDDQKFYPGPGRVVAARGVLSSASHVRWGRSQPWICRCAGKDQGRSTVTWQGINSERW